MLDISMESDIITNVVKSNRKRKYGEMAELVEGARLEIV